MEVILKRHAYINDIFYRGGEGTPVSMPDEILDLLPPDATVVNKPVKVEKPTLTLKEKK